MKHRLERVCEVLKRELSETIPRHVSFPATLVTVQGVDVTPDLKNAHVYVSVIGSEEEQKKSVGKLNDNRQLLQHELTKRVVLKYTPHLHFRLDDSIARGDRVMDILNKIEIPPDEE
ncbi:MAG: ribosome-binding factor [Chthoniobacter sp.]|jgi:ribosome-binding factor A|nr:ribosome-binding factor [Chthoniobacter sp.]